MDDTPSSTLNATRIHRTEENRQHNTNYAMVQTILEKLWLMKYFLRIFYRKYYDFICRETAADN